MIRTISIIIIVAIKGIIVTLLWNELLPSLFDFTRINYLQAVGLIVLGNTLFSFSFKETNKE